MTSKFWACVCGLVLATTAQAKEPLLAEPIDEAANDRSFEMFRTVLRAAVDERNVNYVVSQSCPDILVSFGGEGGRDELRAFLTVPEETLSDEYKPQAAAMRDAHWTALEQVLDMGGSFTVEGEFWAPYTFNIDLPEDWDAFATYFVTGTNVMFRRQPDPASQAVAALSHTAVTVESYDPEADYQAAELAAGLAGYIHRDYLRSAVDYRAGFRKNAAGHWQLCTFVAGD